MKRTLHLFCQVLICGTWLLLSDLKGAEAVGRSAHRQLITPLNSFAREIWGEARAPLAKEASEEEVERFLVQMENTLFGTRAVTKASLLERFHRIERVLYFDSNGSDG